MVATGRAQTRPPLPAFGRLLKDLRVAADLTQEELAERAGVSARLISDLERGVIHRPRRDTVKMLADGLELSGSDRDSFAFLARGKVLRSVEPITKPETLEISSLPIPPNTIIGRLVEIDATVALLLNPEIRLLTLTGPGGVGKTRLAVEAARSAAGSFPDGAYFVDLSPLRDTEFVPQAIAQTLGVRPKENESIQGALISYLKSRSILLLLDNFEHLSEAAVAISDLLVLCPGLKVLATSRVALKVQIEREFTVAPLKLPMLDHLPLAEDLHQIPAVELFVERAVHANTSFHLTNENAPAIADIAIRLDGLPLAIELAAARMKIMSAGSLCDRLEHRLPLLTGGPHDAPARQQTVRSTIDWSHDLLSATERRLFRRLAVFSGGCTLEAAEAVSNASEGTSPEIFDELTNLIEQNLLRVTTAGSEEYRFDMLETIREYGVERLGESGEELTIRNRHAVWCLELAEAAEYELLGPDRQAWYDRLERENANVTAAISWLLAESEVESAMRIAGAMFRFWANSGRLEETRKQLDELLGAGVKVDPVVEAKVLQGRGVISHFQGSYTDATRSWERALDLNLKAGNKLGIGSSYGNLGLAADDQGDWVRASELYKAALEIFIEIDDKSHVNFMYNNLSVVAYMQGDLDSAESYAGHSLKLSEEMGDPDAIAYALGNLGQAAFGKGDYERATSLQTEALSRRIGLTNQPPLIRNLENFAHIAAMTNRPVRAARLFGAAEALRTELGIPLPPGDQTLDRRYIDQARSCASELEFQAAWDEGKSMTVAESIAFALSDSNS